MSNKAVIAAIVAAAVSSAAYAQQTQPATTGVGTPTQALALTTLPSNAMTVTNYYKQTVYDLMSDEFCAASSSSWRGGNGRQSIAR